MSQPLMKNSTNAPVPVADYAHAVEVPMGNGISQLYLCAMGPRDKDTNEVPGVVKDEAGNITDFDIEAQTRNVVDV